MTPAKTKFALLASAALMISSAAYAQSPPATPMASTSIADSTAKADPDMAKVLGALSELGPKPIETLTPSEARKQYSATDAVKKVIKDEKLDVDPHKGCRSPTATLPTWALRLRYYTPENATKDSGFPVIVYFRGGGWVIADLDTYDASASAIARKPMPSSFRWIIRWRRNTSFRPRMTKPSRPTNTS